MVNPSFLGVDGSFRYKFASSADEGGIYLIAGYEYKSPWALMVGVNGVKKSTSLAFFLN